MQILFLSLTTPQILLLVFMALALVVMILHFRSMVPGSMPSAGWPKLAFSLFPNIKIKGVNMDVTLKRSQFIDDGAGNMIVRGHIVPETETNQIVSVENDTQEYETSDGGVATITADPDDKNKYVITMKSLGSVSLTAKADGNLKTGPDEVKPVTGVLNLTIVEDEASKLEMVLDL